MVTRSAALALLFVLVACGAFAQSSAEYGRSTSGEIVLTPKNASPISGSLELSLSRGGDVFGLGNSTGYGMTAGGTLIQDRLWFFAAGSRQERSGARLADLQLPENATTGAIGARLNGQIGSGHDFSAYFQSARQPAVAVLPDTSTLAFVAPSSFLSLRYTGMVSSNMMFSASFTRSTTD